MVKLPVTVKDLLAGSIALKVCSNVARSGALAQAICALDTTKIGGKFSFTYDRPFSSADKGDHGVIISTSKGWIALSTSADVLGISSSWSGTELFLTWEFQEQFKDVVMTGLPSIAMAKLLDISIQDEAQAMFMWKSIQNAVDEGIRSLTENE
jgi:hypothetical protein